MTKKLNSRSHLARRRLAAGRRIGVSAIRSRPLRVEVIEDRFLLSGNAVFGLDISLILHDSKASGFIVIPADIHIGEYRGESSLAELISFSQDNVFPHSWNSLNYDTIIGDGHLSLNDGGNFIRFVIDDLPSDNSQGGMIDVGKAPRQPFDAVQETMLAQKAGDSSRVETGKASLPLSGSAAPKMEVDGAHGTVQVFEIAAAAGIESKTTLASLPKDAARTASPEGSFDATRKSHQFAQHAFQELKSAGNHVASNLMHASSSLNAAGEDRFRVNSLDTPLEATAAADSTEASPVGLSDLAASNAHSVSTSALARAAAPSEICRQAVFAEMTEDTVEKASFPISLGEYRTRNLAGVAIVAIVGQHFREKWRQSSPPVKTHQIPPRRRNLTA